MSSKPSNEENKTPDGKPTEIQTSETSQKENIIEVDDIRTIDKFKYKHNQVLKEARTGVHYKIIRYTNKNKKEIIRTARLKDNLKSETGRQEGQDKYKKEYDKEIIKYFTITKEKTEINKDGIRIPIDFPSLEGFCIKKGIVLKTLHNWKKSHFSFLQAFTRAKYLIKININKYALNGGYNQNYAKFVAANCTDQREMKYVNTNETPQKGKIASQVEELEDELAKIRSTA